MAKKKGLKVIGCGPRDFNDYEVLEQAIKESGFEIAEMVHGKCKGADMLFDKYAKNNKIPVKDFPAEWDNLELPGAVVKSRMNPWKKVEEKYNATAGNYRNEKMAEYGEACIAIQVNGDTAGTSDMIKKAKAKGLKVFIYTGPEKKDEDYEYRF